MPSESPGPFAREQRLGGCIVRRDSTGQVANGIELSRLRVRESASATRPTTMRVVSSFAVQGPSQTDPQEAAAQKAHDTRMASITPKSQIEKWRGGKNQAVSSLRGVVKVGISVRIVPQRPLNIGCNMRSLLSRICASTTCR